MRMNRNELNERQLTSVYGGYCYDNAWDGSPQKRFQAIDDRTGDVIGSFPRPDDAEKCCHHYNMSTEQLNWKKLSSLRETGSFE